MTDKKLFFGVDQEMVEARRAANAEQKRREELAAAQAKLAQEQAERQAQEQADRERWNQAYLGKRKFSLPRILVKVNLAWATLLLVCGSVLHSCDSWTADTDNGRPIFNDSSRAGMPYKVALHDAYIPTDRYNYSREYGLKEKTENLRFAPKPEWYSTVMLTMFGMICSILYARSRKKDYEIVDMMRQLYKYGKAYNMNDAKVRKLIASISGMIEYISANDRAYFDMLMAGDIKIDDAETMRKMASRIIVGHLRTNPSDAYKIYSMFDADSLPTEVVGAINQCSR